MSINQIEYAIKLVAETKELVAGVKIGVNALEKLRDTNTSLNAANKLRFEAEQKLQQANESGNQKAIKQAEALLNSREKAVQQLENQAQREVIGVVKFLDAQDRATQRVNALVESEAAQRAKIEAQKQKSIEKTLELQVRGIEGVAKNITKTFESLVVGDNPLKGLEKILEGIGQIAGTLPVIGQLGEGFAKVSAFGIGLAESFAEITREAIESQKQIDQLTTTTGVNAETISALRIAAEQIGQSFIQVVGAIDLTAEAVNRAREGVKKDVDVFEKLKVALSDVNGNERTLNDILDETILKFGALEAGTEKAGIGYKLFGLRAQKVIDQAAPAFEQLKEKIRDSGIVLDRISATKLRDLSLDLVDIQTKLTGLRNIVGAEFADEFSDIARNASQAFKEFRENADIKDGLEITLQVIQKLVQVIGNTLVDVVKGAGRLLAGFGNTLAQLPEGVQKLLGINKDLIKGLKDAGQATVDLANGGINLSAANEATGKSIDALGDKVKALTKEQEIQLKNLELQSEREIEAVKKRILERSIGEEEGARQIAAINEKIAAQKVRNAQVVDNIVKNEVISKREALENQINIARNAESQILKDKEAFSKQRVESEKLAESLLLETITKIEETKARVRSNLALQAGDATQRRLKEFDDQIVAAKQAFQQIQFDNLQKNENLKKQEEEKAEKIKELTQDLVDFNKAVDTNTVLDASVTSEKLIKFRENLSLAKQNLIKSENEKEKSANEDNVKVTKAALEEKKKDLEIAINQAKEQSQNLLAAITGTSVEAAEKRTQALRRPILIELEGLERILTETKVVGNDRQEVEKKIASLKAELAKKEKDGIRDAEKARQDANKERIQDLTNEIEKNTALSKVAKDKEEAAIKDIVDKFTKGQLDKESAIRRTTQVALDSSNQQLANAFANLADLEEQKSKTADKDKEIVLAQAEINRLQRESAALQKSLKGEIDNTSDAVKGLKSAFGSVKEELGKVKSGEEAINDRVEKLGDRANSVADKLKGGLSGFISSVDISGESIEKLQDRIEGLTGTIKFLQEKVAVAGKDVLIRELEESVAKLNERIVKQVQGAAIEAAQKAADEKLKKEQETEEKLAEIQQNAIDRTLEANEKLEKGINDLREDSEDEEGRHNQKLIDLEDDKNKDILAIREKQAKEEKEIADRAITDEEERQGKIKKIKEKATESAATQANDIARKGLLEILNLERQIAAEKDPKKKLELENKLTSEREKVSRAKRKQEEIEALASENLTEEEFNARKDAIEERFRLEQEAADERLEILKEEDEAKRNQALADLDRLIKDQEERNKKAEDNRIKRVKEEQDRQKAEAEEEAAQRRADYEKQEQDRIDAYNEQVENEKEEHNQRLEDLKERGEQIRNTYKETLGDIQEDQKKAAEELAKSVGLAADAFSNAFDRANAKGKELLGTLGKINSELEQSQNTGNSSNGGGSSNSSNPGNTSNPNSSSSSSSSSNSSNNSNSSNSSNSNNSNNSSSTNTNSSSSSPSSSSNNSSSGESKNEKKKERAEEIASLPKTAKSSSEYKAGMIKVFDSFAATEGGNPLKTFRNYVEVAKGLTVSYFQNNGITSVNPQATTPLSIQIQGFLGNGQHFANALNQLSFARDKKVSKDSRTRYISAVDKVIAFLESSKKQKEKIDKFQDVGEGSGGKIIDAPPLGGSLPGDKGNDGFGDKGKPTIPNAPPPSGRNPTDQEKAFFAGRDKDSRNNSSEGFNEETDKIIDPDTAIDPAARASNPKRSLEPVGQPIAQQAPTINNQPTFAPQLSINNKFVIETKERPETMEKKLNDLNSALEQENTAAAISLLQTLDQRTLRVVKSLLQ